MRPDGKPEGLRQAMSWMHTWVGLLLGWLLYAVFFTGTLSYFRDEIDDWMKPETHRSVPAADSAERALAAMQRIAPDATTWSLTLPRGRQTVVDASWREPGAPPGREGQSRAVLDATTGEPIIARETAGAGFLYRFHFELHAIPREWGRWIVGVATMLMFAAILSGVITHKKIFTEFFTFRPKKGQRSWLDAHNATGVLALPFHVVITFSGLLLLMVQLMPWGIETVYDGDRRAYMAEMRGQRPAGQAAGGAASPEAPAARAPAAAVRAGGGEGRIARERGERGERRRGREAVEPVEMAPFAPMLAQAAQAWPNGIGSITVNAPNTARATLDLREAGGHSLVSGRGGAAATMSFDAVSGERRPARASTEPHWLRGTMNVFTSIHLGQFAAPAVRWLLFLSGVVGTAMVASGLVLWVVKRLPERRKLGRTPWGHRAVEVLNVAAIGGLSVATAAYFWANRLLPAGLDERPTWEIRVFFGIWAACLVHAALRRHRHAWIEQLAAAALLFATLPLLNPLTGGAGLATTIARGQWSIAGFELSVLALAALHAAALAWLLRPAGVAARRTAPAQTPEPELLLETPR